MQNLQLKFIVNPTTIRLFRTLNLLERTHTVTKGRLSTYNNVTERTTLSDMNKLKGYFEDSVNIMSTNYGYSFELKNHLLFLEQKAQLLENEVLFEMLGNIFFGELEELDDLLDRFQLSRSSFRRYLKNIEPVFHEYGVELILSPIDLIGNEANIRKFFKDFYYESEMTPHTVVPPKELHVLIRETFYAQFSKFSVGTGTSPAEFYYNLYIAIERVQQGRYVTLPQELVDRVKTSKDFHLFSQICPPIERHYHVSLSEVECCWLFLVTVTKRPLNRITQEKIFCEQLQLPDFLVPLTDKYLLECLPGVLASEGYWVLQSFHYSWYINHLITPVQNKIMPEVIEQTQQENEALYRKNHAFLSAMLPILAITETCLEDIAASLTLLVSRLVEQYSDKRKKIVFLLEGDLYICQRIRARVVQYFGARHDLIFMTVQVLTDDFFGQEEIDLVVTNYSDYLSEYPVATEYLLLKTIPDKQDWHRLFKKIEPELAELVN